MSPFLENIETATLPFLELFKSSWTGRSRRDRRDTTRVGASPFDLDSGTRER
jgi:hypothetical protein